MRVQIWQHSPHEVCVHGEGGTYRVLIEWRWFRSPTLRIERVGGTTYFQAASLDENDAALVEAMAKEMRRRFGVAWCDTESLDECDPEVAAEHRADAIAAIIAARNHITGGTE